MALAAVRLGLVGAGRWGRSFLLTVPTVAGARLSRIASGNPETRGLVPRGCVVVPDWREVACARDLDGVIIATPPRLHAEMARAALAAGLAVLVEKPLTMDSGEARGLLGLASELGGLVLVDHTHLFHPGYGVLKERARELKSRSASTRPRSRSTAFQARSPCPFVSSTAARTS